jgi:hypothetical protein
MIRPEKIYLITRYGFKRFRKEMADLEEMGEITPSVAITMRIVVASPVLPRWSFSAIVTNKIPENIFSAGYFMRLCDLNEILESDEFMAGLSRFAASHRSNVMYREVWKARRRGKQLTEQEVEELMKTLPNDSDLEEMFLPPLEKEANDEDSSFD